jgi:hypothetical protein
MKSIQLLILVREQAQRQHPNVSVQQFELESVLFNSRVWLDLFSDKYESLYDEITDVWYEFVKAKKRWREEEDASGSWSLLDLVTPQGRHLHSSEKLLLLLYCRTKLLLLLWQVELRAKLNESADAELQQLRNQLFESIAQARVFIKTVHVEMNA